MEENQSNQSAEKSQEELNKLFQKLTAENPDLKFYLRADTRVWAFVDKGMALNWLLLQAVGVGSMIWYMSGVAFYGLVWAFTQWMMLELLVKNYEPK